MSKLVINLNDQESIETGLSVLNTVTCGNTRPVGATQEVLKVDNTPAPPVQEAPKAETPAPPAETPAPNISVEELNAGMVEVYNRLGSRDPIMVVLATYNDATSISTIDPSLYGEVLAKVKAL